ELVTAIRAVMAGGVYVSPGVARLLVASWSRPGKAGRSGSVNLAPREREVLRRIADGQSTKEIAHALRVSTKTIETHRRRLMEKLNLHSVAELTKYAISEGIS